MNYLLIIILLLSTGCASHKPKMTVVVPPVSGTTLSSSEMELLRSGEVVKKYYVGAYVDPSRPQIRHDPHVVERIEQTSRWNLRPNVPVVASGPTYKAVEENALKNAMQQQYDDEIKKQRSANTEVQSQTATLKQEVSDLKAMLVSQGESDLKKIEGKIDTLSTKVASLENASSVDKSKTQLSLGSSSKSGEGNSLGQQSPQSKSMTPSSQETKPWEASVQGE